MIWGIVTAGAALLLILVALLHAQRRRNRLEKEMVERARTTDLYRALYPVLRTANRCCVDRVLIRRDEVRIVLFKPMNSVYRFVFEERGFDRVNDRRCLGARTGDFRGHGSLARQSLLFIQRSAGYYRCRGTRCIGTNTTFYRTTRTH